MQDEPTVVGPAQDELVTTGQVQPELTATKPMQDVQVQEVQGTQTGDGSLEDCEKTESVDRSEREQYDGEFWRG